MRRRLSVLGAAALLVGQVACAQGAVSEREREAIEDELGAFVTSLFDAMNEGDVEAIASHYAATPGFVYVGCTVVTQGFEQVRSLMDMWYSSNPDLTFTHQVQATTVLDRNAAAVSVNATTSQDGYLFWTFVTERTTQGWKIVHEHESWADCPPRRPHPVI